MTKIVVPFFSFPLMVLSSFMVHIYRHVEKAALYEWRGSMILMLIDFSKAKSVCRRWCKSRSPCFLIHKSPIQCKKYINNSENLPPKKSTFSLAILIHHSHSWPPFIIQWKFYIARYKLSEPASEIPPCLILPDWGWEIAQGTV